LKENDSAPTPLPSPPSFVSSPKGEGGEEKKPFLPSALLFSSVRLIYSYLLFFFSLCPPL
jgi:hypothetical protein